MGADLTSPGSRGLTEGEESRRDGAGTMGRSGFVSVTCLEDAQAIRAVAFHPRGNYYAVGSNSKVLRVVQFPNIDTLRYGSLLSVSILRKWLFLEALIYNSFLITRSDTRLPMSRAGGVVIIL